MKNSVSLSIPSQKRFVRFALKIVEEATDLVKFDAKKRDEVLAAVRELVENAVKHAYPKGETGIIDVEIRFLPHGLSIEVHDMGLPMDFERIYKTTSGGLKRVEEYVDKLHFTNHGQKGKSFAIFKSHERSEVFEDTMQPYSDLEDNSPASLKPSSITIRDFQAGDEEAISRLIYSNYTYSYYKSLFYYPQKIKELNEKGEIYSIVAEDAKAGVVGHFALVKLQEANCAEIGVAVVHPDFKGRGIMNAMLERVLEKAKEVSLDAIFGEAVMLHPFSQRANLSHGFGESALVLGIVPNTISLRDKNALHTDKRTAVLVAYKILQEKRKNAIFLPKKYAELVRRIYKNNDLEIEEAKPSGHISQQKVTYELSHYTNTATLVIDRLDEHIRSTIKHYLMLLYKKHVDMIFADINLMQCEKIDEVIKKLQKEGFVFSGVLFYRRNQDDYLRLQLVNSDNVETKNIVCYSGFCHELIDVINKELSAK